MRISVDSMLSTIPEILTSSIDTNTLKYSGHITRQITYATIMPIRAYRFIKLLTNDSYFQYNPPSAINTMAYRPCLYCHGKEGYCSKIENPLDTITCPKTNRTQLQKK